MMRRFLHIWMGVGLTAVLLLITNHSRASSNSPAALIVTAPGRTGVTLAEIDEFATTVIGDPWDMNQATDLIYYRDESAMTNPVFSNGLFSATMNNSNSGSERVNLLAAGAANNSAMRIGRIGYNYPINADHYRYLTFRMYRSNSGYNSGVAVWFADDTYTNAVMGASNSYLVGPDAGWDIYTLDLQTIGIQSGGQNWTGTIRELFLHPFAGPGALNATLKLDWARLTAADPRTARPYTITWDGNDNGEVEIWASPNNTTLGEDHDVLIAANVTGTSYEWQTGVMQAGTYYIAVKMGSEVAWSQGPLILNTVPEIEITKPSMVSGEDYAASLLGNAWDMNDTDFNNTLYPWWDTCLTNESYIGGIYHADFRVCNDAQQYSDPKLILGHMHPNGVPVAPIDTDRFRYLSFRYSHSGTQNVYAGWVARWGWWNATSGGVLEAPVMSRDIILFEEWTEYRADLWRADVVDEAHPIQRSWRASSPNHLRFDPSELDMALFPAYFELDWIKLTAMDEGQRNSVFPIRYQIATDLPANLTLYYDTDTNAGNGRTLIGAVNNIDMAAAPALVTPSGGGDQFIYLPLVMNNYISDCDSNSCYIWNTTGVAPGDYYICIQINDAYNSSYRCSDAPVRIR